MASRAEGPVEMTPIELRTLEADVAGGRLDLFIRRPVYLAITGYLVSYLGQQRQQLEERMRVLEASAERMRIGRDLHDGYAQALAGVTLRLEATRRLLSTGASFRRR